MIDKFTCEICGEETVGECYSHAYDAFCCGFCFSAKVRSLRTDERNRFTPEIYQERELSFIAYAELRLEVAKRDDDHQAIEIYKGMLRFLEA